MIQQRMHHLSGGTPQIIVSQASFLIGWALNSRDYFSIDVRPNSMSWSTAIEDTGNLCACNRNW